MNDSNLYARDEIPHRWIQSVLPVTVDELDHQSTDYNNDRTQRIPENVEKDTADVHLGTRRYHVYKHCLNTYYLYGIDVRGPLHLAGWHC